MATKPFYSLSETQTKLGINEAQLKQLVQEGKLQQITSQGQTHYRSVDVERLAVDLGMSSETPSAPLEPVVPDSAPLDFSGATSSEQSKDLGLSESVGFAVPAESNVLDEHQGGSSGENDLGSAELGLSESVGFSLAGGDKSVATNKLPEANSQSVPLAEVPSGADRSNTPPPPPLEEGELGLSESIGFSQLDDEGQAKLPPGTELSSSGTIPAEKPDMDLSLSHNLANLGGGNEESQASVEELSLNEADKEPKKVSKGDTVITSAGISVFDDEDLEASAADPLAKTTIAPSVDEHQLSLEGVGSGSGLLDLTRETDDTSLDAELLDEIYPGSGQQMSISAVSSAHGSTLMDRGGAGSAATSAASIAGIDQFAAIPTQVVVEYVEEVERKDPYEIAFTITLIISTLVMLMVGITSASLVSGVMPAYVKGIVEGWTGFMAASIVIAAIGLGVGLLLGRQRSKRMLAEIQFAERQAAKDAQGSEAPAAEATATETKSESPAAEQASSATTA